MVEMFNITINRTKIILIDGNIFELSLKNLKSKKVDYWILK